jgi:hypothetical protein
VLRRPCREDAHTMQGLRTCPKALIPESRENHNIANGQKTNHLTASIMQISVVIFRVRPPISDATKAKRALVTAPGM